MVRGTRDRLLADIQLFCGGGWRLKRGRWGNQEALMGRKKEEIEERGREMLLAMVNAVHNMGFLS